MKVKLNFLFLVIFCFRIVFDVAASDTLTIPSLYPSSYAIYDIEQGLPFSCINQTFTDLKLCIKEDSERQKKITAKICRSFFCRG
jgi:hypothetical protein